MCIQLKLIANKLVGQWIKVITMIMLKLQMMNFHKATSKTTIKKKKNNKILKMKRAVKVTNKCEDNLRAF